LGEFNAEIKIDKFNPLFTTLKTARDFRDRYHDKVEIRAYADPVREENGNWDYGLVEF